jgi:hypothetical protein
MESNVVFLKILFIFAMVITFLAMIELLENNNDA